MPRSMALRGEIRYGAAKPKKLKGSGLASMMKQNKSKKGC